MFSEGDTIILLEYIGTEWLRGELRGQRGMFPVAFVEVIEALPMQNSVVSMTSWDDAPVSIPIQALKSKERKTTGEDYISN